MFTIHYKLDEQSPWKVDSTHDDWKKAVSFASNLLADGFIVRIDEE